MEIKPIHLNKDNDNLSFSKKDYSSLSPVTRYIFIISEIMKEYNKDKSKRLFFRGQACEKWAVEPGVFRKNFLSVEHELICSSISRNPNEFVNMSDFALLAKLQHYGLPTRLLDITQNPLVALYFACEQEKDCDGAVYVALASSFLPETDKTKMLSCFATIDLNHMKSSEIVKILAKKNVFIKTYYNKTSNNYKQICEKAISYFVLPDMNHERIIRQSGAFLLCGSINIEEENNTVKITKSSEDQHSKFDYKIIICYKEKDRILNELDLLNINEAALFPELENQLTYVKNRHG